MLFGSNRSSKFRDAHKVTVYVAENQLERVDSFKYLGITIHQHMKWADHIDKISKKINQRIGLIRRIKILLPAHARRTLYMSLIAPLYADNVWGDKNNDTLMKDLQILMNRAAKIIVDKPRLLKSYLGRNKGFLDFIRVSPTRMRLLNNGL